MAPMNLRLIRCLPLALLIVACGPPEITVVEPIQAVNWSPHDGATGIEVTWEPSVCLSLEVDEATLGHVTLREGESDPGSVPETQVTANVALSGADGRCIVFREPALEAGRTYHMVLAPGLQTTDGSVLDYRLSSRFRTAAE
jgi:hypothetical protein